MNDTRLTGIFLALAHHSSIASVLDEIREQGDDFVATFGNLLELIEVGAELTPEQQEEIEKALAALIEYGGLSHSAYSGIDSRDTFLSNILKFVTELVLQPLRLVASILALPFTREPFMHEIKRTGLGLIKALHAGLDLTSATLKLLVRMVFFTFKLPFAILAKTLSLPLGTLGDVITFLGDKMSAFAEHTRLHRFSRNTPIPVLMPVYWIGRTVSFIGGMTQGSAALILDIKNRILHGLDATLERPILKGLNYIMDFWSRCFNPKHPRFFWREQNPPGDGTQPTESPAPAVPEEARTCSEALLTRMLHRHTSYTIRRVNEDSLALCQKFHHESGLKNGSSHMSVASQT